MCRKHTDTTQPTHLSHESTNTDTHTPQEMYALTLQAITYLENKQKTAEEKLTEFYASFSSEAYQNMPTHTLTIGQTRVTFLVDSGATISLIRHDALNPTPKMSARYLKTVGVSGSSMTERYTTHGERSDVCFGYRFKINSRGVSGG